MPPKKRKKSEIEVKDDDEPPIKKAKSNQTIAFERRQEEMEDRTYSYLTMKLTSFCKTEVFTDNTRTESVFINTIRDIVLQVNQVIMESYQFMNLHLLKCLENNVTLPILNTKFFMQCTKAVVENIETTITDPYLLESLNEFKSLRPINKDYKIIKYNQSIGHIIDLIARQQISTVCFNHIIFSFEKRLHRYMLAKLNMKKYEAKQYLYYLFEDDFEKNKNKPKKKLTDHELQFKNWLQWYPNKYTISNNLNHFIKLSYEILLFMEESLAINYTRIAAKKTKNEKVELIPGVKLFSVFPTKSGFTMSHIFINTRALQCILKTIKAENPNELLMFTKKEVDSRYKVEDNPKYYWKKLFNYKKFETKDKEKPLKEQRTFDFSIATNGYKVSVRYLKPKRNDELDKDEEQLKIIKNDRKLNRKTRFEEENPGLELNNININEFDRLIGLDPGKNYFATTFDSNGLSKAFKTNEYLSRSFRYRYEVWYTNFTNTHKEYQEIIQNMPTLKTANYEKLKKSIQYYMRHCNYLFQTSLRLQRWSFKLKRFKEITLNEYAKKLIGPSKNVCIGFGNMKNRPMKKRPMFPIADFKKALTKRNAVVITLDEFRTTALCHKCYNYCDKLKSVPENIEINGIKQTFIKRRGFLHYLSRSKLKEKTKRINEIPYNNTSTYAEYLRCKYNGCKKYMHRDVNSSRNHLMLLKQLLFTKDPLNRPDNFRRNVKKQVDLLKELKALNQKWDSQLSL